MKLFIQYFRSRLWTAALAAALAGLFFLLVWLGGLDRSTALYGLLLWTVLCAGALAAGFLRCQRRHRQLKEAQAAVLWTPDCLPEPESPLEEDYQELVRTVLEDRAARMTEADRQSRETADYFTLWAHQIKNPLAAMGLILQQGEPLDAGELEQELFETERCVDLALNVLRLEGEGTDFVFRPCKLDELIRQTVKKYAGQFIRRKIRLDYEGTELCVTTDEKWLGFALEQLLSNALKYTPAQGSVRIRTEGDCLFVRDTGVGIAPEDLPRVFERGYTGANGRTDKKATGVGLWLCRRALEGLGHTVALRSAPGQGTEAVICFARDGEQKS